ncbi:hypothetical protein ABBQ38_013141 [Trebouxia sp. C0009 RCD-2024]
MQPYFCQQSCNTIFGVRPRLSRFRVQDRSCFACIAAQADVPDYKVEAAQQVRYRGVSKVRSYETYISQIRFQGRAYYIGRYSTPEQAARMFDEARVVIKKDPVNFPKSQYDEAALRQIPDLGTFIERRRPTCRPRSRKTSRFIGVSHLKASGKWKCRAPLNGRPGSSGPTLGAYTTEELAAQAYDKMLIYTGMATKNFPREKYDVQPILMHETIDSLVASIRAEAAASEQRQQHPQKLSAAAGTLVCAK